MSKKHVTETIIQESKTNLFPVILLLIANLIAILVAIAILMVRTQSLVDGNVGGITADRMGQIKLDQGNVVIDLMDLDASSNRHKVTKQLVMRQEDFLAGFGAMEDFMKKLIEAGFVTPRGAASDPDSEQ